MQPWWIQRLLFGALFLVAPLDNCLAGTAAMARAEPTVAADSADSWRRTSQGWQRMSSWPTQSQRPAGSPVASIHPLIPATLIGLISIGALIGFETPQRRSRQG